MKTTLSLLPEPRSYAGTAIMLGAVTGLPFAVLWTWLDSAMLQRSFGELLPVGVGVGLFFGVSFGLTMAFFLKGKTATVAVAEPKGFVNRLHVAMSQLGYHPATQIEDFFTYAPSFQAGLAAGRMAVQLQEGQAVIVGPKMYVEKLLQRLGQ
jgi:uncharacterized protein (DUF1501 family)